MPTGVALDVDPEAKKGTVPPTNEEGRKKRTPINSAPEEVKKGKKLESNSSKNTIRGAASKKTSNRLNDGPILILHQQVQRRMLVFKWLHQTESKRMIIAEGYLLWKKLITEFIK